jgi:hypothetical protein
MKNHAVMLSSMLFMLTAALVAAHFGQWLPGFALFALAITPLPTAFVDRVHVRYASVRRSTS